MNYRRLLTWPAILLLFVGCNRPSSPVAATSTRTNIQLSPVGAVSHLDHAQPKLKTIKLWVGAEVLETELALTPTEVATGMMFRTDMGENEGMLFVFRRPYRTSFYMKNTRVPLSAAYIDSEGRILEIHDLQPLNENPVYADSDRVQYVLEVKQGWFERHKVPVGTLIRTEFGSLAETFR